MEFNELDPVAVNDILDYLEQTVQPIDVANLKFKHFEVDWKKGFPFITSAKIDDEYPIGYLVLVYDSGKKIVLARAVHEHKIEMVYSNLRTARKGVIGKVTWPLICGNVTDVFVVTINSKYVETDDINAATIIDSVDEEFKHQKLCGYNGNIEFGRSDTAVFFYDNVSKKYYYMDEDRDYSKQQFDTINDAIRGAIADLAQGSNLDTLVDLDMFMNEVTSERLDYWDGNKTPYFSQHPLFNKGWPGYALGQIRMRIFYD